MEQKLVIDKHTRIKQYTPSPSEWGYHTDGFYIQFTPTELNILDCKMDQIRNLYHTNDFIISIARGQKFIKTWTGDLAFPFHQHVSLPGIS